MLFCCCSCRVRVWCRLVVYFFVCLVDSGNVGVEMVINKCNIVEVVCVVVIFCNICRVVEYIVINRIWVIGEVVV